MCCMWNPTFLDINCDIALRLGNIRIVNCFHCDIRQIPVSQYTIIFKLPHTYIQSSLDYLKALYSIADLSIIILSFVEEKNTVEELEQGSPTHKRKVNINADSKHVLSLLEKI